tara:strand:+ start:1261 stop:1602 length:342 start_codon:yes stop_codon:yes gene_type:complete
MSPTKTYEIAQRPIPMHGLKPEPPGVNARPLSQALQDDRAARLAPTTLAISPLVPPETIDNLESWHDKLTMSYLALGNMSTVTLTFIGWSMVKWCKDTFLPPKASSRHRNGSR